LPLVDIGHTPDAEIVAVRAGGAVPTRREVERWAASRQLYLDNLKVIVVAVIIAGHGIASYTALELWAYADVREVTLAPVTEAMLLAVVAPFGLFMIPLLFLIAGLLTPGSVRRKGPGAYARDRLLRLGVPFAIFAGLVWPALLYALYRPLGNAPGSYWAEFIGTSEESLDTGYLWFVGDLLIFSLVYAGWVRLRNAPRAPRRHGEITVGQLGMLAAAVASATFLVRLAFPFDSEKYVDLNLYQWPECVALFGVGVLTARHGWLTAVPDRLRRHSRAATLAAVAGLALFIGFGAATGTVNDETWGGGWNIEALIFAALESVLAVFGPMWLLGVAQRRLNRRFAWAGPAISRSAYGAFLVQGLLLIGLAVALRPLPLPAELKALIVAGGGVVGSFALARLLISRVPGVARIL
jgi:Acyltransferase family